MLIRLQGFVLIVNTLIPVLLLGGVASGFLYWKERVSAQWTIVEPELVAIRDSAGATVLLVQATTDRVTGHLKKAGVGLDAVGQAFANASETVAPTLREIEKVTVPGVRVTTVQNVLCGYERKGRKVQQKSCWPHVQIVESKLGVAVAKPFRDVYAALATAATPLSDIKLALGELDALGALPGKAAEARAAISIVASETIRLAGPLGTIFTIVGYVSIFLLLWFGAQYGVRGTARLRAGCRMLVAGDGSLPAV
ncbi:MAG: hypothetical protein O3B08_02800 [Proteobacteria bacterium]|nr:hypothetical protein [Pseudomonadota bacterium]